MTRLDDATWRDVEPGSILVLPLGSTEQHGPHLPLTTDADLATALAVALERDRVVTLAPTQPFGASGEHQDFAGTLSIGSVVLHELLVELVRSATCTFDAVYLINGHGGNAPAIASAVTQLRHEGRQVRVFTPHLEADLHAGEFETSLMLHLHPERVRAQAREPGNTSPLAELWPVMSTHGVRTVSTNGVLGDPTHATAASGAASFAALTAQLLADFDEWRNSIARPQGAQHGERVV